MEFVLRDSLLDNTPFQGLTAVKVVAIRRICTFFPSSAPIELAANHLCNIPAVDLFYCHIKISILYA